VFIAIGSILLMKGFLEQYGLMIEPLALSMWAIPTAICASVIHGTRVMLWKPKPSARAELVDGRSFSSADEKDGRSTGSGRAGGEGAA
jgi:uncharacterized membrane protein